MAAIDEMIEPAAAAQPSNTDAVLVVCLSSAYVDASQQDLDVAKDAVRRALELVQSTVGRVIVAAPSTQAETQTSEQDGFHLLSYTAASTGSLTAHTASNWLAYADLLRSQQATAGLLLGAEVQSLAPEALAGMLDAVLKHEADLALPHYVLPVSQGLLNQSILAPLSRSLFAARIGFPLALDAAFSGRMADRMVQAAQRVPAAAQAETVVWPVDEAAVAGLDIAEVGNTPRTLPQVGQDLSQILRDVAGSLFADIELKATFWQRVRPSKEILRLEPVAAPEATSSSPADDEEIDDLLASFRIGYSNLHDIWSLVLPPQTLVNLKRLSQAPRDNFVLADSVWVRIVYDFVLAHRLRTLSRGHLLGALTPLYLAWVASHLVALRNGTATTADALGRAFEADRPYLVSRWRWPDRFNP